MGLIAIGSILLRDERLSVTIIRSKRWDLASEN
jgi:hypothetical protein